MSQSTGEMGCFAKLGTVIDDYWRDALSATLPFLILAGTVGMSDEFLNRFFTNSPHRETIRIWSLVAIGLGGILGIISAVIIVRRNKAVSKLKAENTTLRASADLLQSSVRELVDGYLAAWATGPLKFAGDNEKRISLYTYDEGGDQFVLRGRFSLHPTFRKANRAIYPADQGCIYQAWENGSVFENSLPDYARAREGYLKIQRKYGIPDELACSMGMKPRLYYGHRVTDDAHRHLAVIIVEALSPDAFQQIDLANFFGHQERKFISHLISVLQPYFIVPSDAAKAGM